MQRFGSVSVSVILVCAVGLVSLVNSVGCASGGRGGGGGSSKPVGAESAEQLKPLPGGFFPDWWDKEKTDKNRIIAYASQTSLDLQMAINKAAQEGRVAIAQTVRAQVGGRIRLFFEEAGLAGNQQAQAHSQNVSEAIVSESLTGVTINKQEVKREGNSYRAYVQMVMPRGEIDSILRNKIEKDEMYSQKLSATQAYQELNSDLEKYKEEKKLQNQ